MIVLLSLRPIMSDLEPRQQQHFHPLPGRGHPHGLAEGLRRPGRPDPAYAIAFKVTPGLFLLYFAYKRSWRTVGATALGMGMFLLVVPSLFLGRAFNWTCLTTWWKHDLEPLRRERRLVRSQEMNQSLVGVISRLLTENGPGWAGTPSKQHGQPRWLVGPQGGRQDAQGALDRPGRPVGLALPDQDQASRRPSVARRVLAGRADDAVRLGTELEAPLRHLAAPLHLPGLSGRGGWPGSVESLDPSGASWSSRPS